MDCCWVSSPGLSLLVQLKSQNPSFLLCGFGNGLDLNPKEFVYFWNNHLPWYSLSVDSSSQIEIENRYLTPFCCQYTVGGGVLVWKSAPMLDEGCHTPRYTFVIPWPPLPSELRLSFHFWLQWDCSLMEQKHTCVKLLINFLKTVNYPPPKKLQSTCYSQRDHCSALRGFFFYAIWGGRQVLIWDSRKCWVDSWEPGNETLVLCWLLCSSEKFFYPTVSSFLIPELQHHLSMIREIEPKCPRISKPYN